ncbi:hypothetical protein GCM10028787_07640 [Brachybacterium horti]
MNTSNLRGSALHAARQVKHTGYVATKRGRLLAQNSMTRVMSAAWRDHDARRPYVYRHGMYRRSFLNWDARASEGAPDIPRRIFTLWTGEGDLPDVRRRGLDELRRMQEGIEIVLVTPRNIDDWIVPGHPLHPAYENLSLVHRSDYLRAYLLHHHGGGYSDVKAPRHHWGPAFDQAHGEGHWLLGYPERSTQWVAQLPRKLGRDLKRYFRIVPGGSAAITRADSTFTREWVAEIERRLDYLAPLLAQNPGGIRNEVLAYPVSWNDLLAKIIHPLALKHHERLALSELLTPDISSYR